MVRALDGAFVIVPLNSKGVRKGEPVDMLGNRDCPQGPCSLTMYVYLTIT
ncbi:hypothetical protein [Vulcanisaeta distributa]|nr:hypothetical protein [Vulcanisaeta distributa]